MSFGQSAEGTKEWDRFWGSGKVEDYLRYRNCRREEGEPKEAAFHENGERKFMDKRDGFS